MVHPRYAAAREVGRRALGAWRNQTAPPPAPDRTGFYTAVDPGPGPRGEVLGAEAMEPVDGAPTWRVRYRTLDAAGHPVAASMAVAVPAGIAPRPRPVVVSVHGAVGVAPGCGPSREGHRALYTTDFTNAGAVVAAPDLTGLGMEGRVHPYLHGTTAGRSVLDAARAAAALTTAGAGSVVALVGHSAGAFAVLWANELAVGEDGDGLDVRLVVASAPIADLAAAMDHFATGRGMGVYAVQLAATWPGVEPVDDALVLTPAAIKRLPHLRTDRLSKLGLVFRGDATTWLRADGFTRGEWAAALTRQSAGRAPGRAPVVVVHGEDDIHVPVQWGRRLAAELDDVELLVYPDADHGSVTEAARTDIVARVLDALT